MSAAKIYTLDNLAEVFKHIGYEEHIPDSPPKPLTPKVLDILIHLIFVILSLDTNFVFLPQGSPAKLTCIANADDAAMVMAPTEPTNPLSPQNLDIQQNQAPSTTAGEGTSHNTLTLEEVLSMKQQNPAETLRKLQKLRQVSTEVHPSSSTAMPTPEMDASITLKLQQLKNYLFEREVLAVVEEEEALRLDILKMLDELDQHKLPALVA